MLAFAGVDVADCEHYLWSPSPSVGRRRMENVKRPRTEPSVVPSARSSQSGRRAYEPPELVTWGTIAELTRAKEEPDTDGFFGTETS